MEESFLQKAMPQPDLYAIAFGYSAERNKTEKADPIRELFLSRHAGWKNLSPDEKMSLGFRESDYRQAILDDGADLRSGRVSRYQLAQTRSIAEMAILDSIAQQ